MPDLATPSPDDGHEALRAPLAQAVADLTDHVARIDDAMLLVLTAFDCNATLLQAVTDVQEQLAALTGRVTALEPSSTPAPVEAP